MKKTYIAIIALTTFLLLVIAGSKDALCCTSPPAMPGTISVTGGSAKVCPDNIRTYSIAAVFEATSYNWTTPTGGIITNGQGTTSITVSYNSNFTVSGTLSVIAIDSCGNSAAKTLTITRNNPGTPSVIAGTFNGVCPNTSGNYLVTNVSGMTYNWIAPTGAGIASGQGTNAVGVNFSGTFVSDYIKVTANNACGTSGVRQSIIYSVPLTPGVITGNVYNNCNATNVYTIKKVTGATGYNWSTNISGATINVSPSPGDTMATVTFPSFTSGTLTVRASNACGLSGPKNLTVKGTVATPAAISGNTSVSPCINETYSTAAITGASSYTWTVPSGSSVISGQGTTSANVQFGTTSGNITVKGVNACGSGSAKSLAVTSAIAAPSGLNATNITSVSAQLNWAAITGASSYNVNYRIVGAGSWTIASSNNNSLNITSLSSSASYEWKVQSVCSTFPSAFSVLSNFTTNTPTPCDSPSGLTATSIASSSASLSWSNVTGAVSYAIQYRTVGGSWLNTTSATNSKTLTGLNAAKTYQWQVQTVCQSSGSVFSQSSSFTTLQNGTDSLIIEHDTWKYLDNGSDQGTAWRGTSFNDASWASGNAELGYGDGDENTIVSYGSNSSAKYITTYFRKTINISNPSAYSSIALNIVRDDGVVIYLNGTETFRFNMPSGTITNTTLASTAIGGTDESTWQNTTLTPSQFVTGTNVIAVEIHQSSGTSSDISFKLRLIGSNSGVIATQRGPYLQMLTPNSIHIRWKTSTATNSRVRYGTDMSYGNTIDSSASVTEHEIKISGLVANTKYYYTIGSTIVDLQGDMNNYFKTSLPAGNNSPFRVWAIGDFGNGSTNQDLVRDAYVTYAGNNPANIWVWVGDNAYDDGTETEFTNKVFAKYPNQFKNTPMYPAIGNHDYADIGYQSTSALGTNFPYFSLFTCPKNGEAGGFASGTEKYYSYNYGNTHFIALDSYGALNNSGSPMYNWLQNDLNANLQRWTIVYWHHPPYTMGTHNSDSDQELINMRQNIVPLLESHKVDLVICGHSHVYERSVLLNGHYGTESTLTSAMKIDAGSGNAPYYLKSSPNFTGTVYAVCGVSGQGGSVGVQSSWPHAAMYSYANTLYGSMVIDFNADTLSAKFITSTGTIYDQFKIVKSGTARFANNSFYEGNASEDLTIFPNPFTDQTIIKYYLDKESPVTIELFDIEGRIIYSNENSVSEIQLQGMHEYYLNKSILKNYYGIFILRFKTKYSVINKLMRRSR